MHRLPVERGRPPGKSGKLPGKSGEVPGKSGELPGNPWIAGKFHSERTSGEVAEKLPGRFGGLPGKSGDFPEARGSLTPSQRLAKFVSNATIEGNMVRTDHPCRFFSQVLFATFQLPRPATGPPSWNSQNCCGDSWEHCGETRVLRELLWRLPAGLPFLCRSRRNGGHRSSSPKQFPQHPEFPRPRHLPQQFWGIQARESCSWPGELQKLWHRVKRKLNRLRQRFI